jgi:hypothetical protein
MASRAAVIASLRLSLKPNVIFPLGVVAWMVRSGGSATRLSRISDVMPHSMAVPLTSPSPWAA